MATIILASASPRRARLLEQVGLSFKVIPAVGVEEQPSRLPAEPGELTRQLALRKAEQVAGRLSRGVVLGRIR